MHKCYPPISIIDYSKLPGTAKFPKKDLNPTVSALITDRFADVAIQNIKTSEAILARKKYAFPALR